MDILLFVAIAPAAFLLYQVYKNDPVEKEPTGLLVKLLIFGAISVIPAIVLEIIGSNVILEHWRGSYWTYLATENYLVIALVEEACKFVFLILFTWKNKAFDYVFDGIVYAVFVSLGFAIAENVMYVFQYGLGTALLRAVTAIPGHCIFAVFMGYFYGQAKYADIKGMGSGKIGNLLAALVVAVALHGTYDFLASVDSWQFVLLFYAFLIAMMIAGYKMVKKQSKEAKRLHDDPSDGLGIGTSEGETMGFGDMPNTSGDLFGKDNNNGFGSFGG